MDFIDVTSGGGGHGGGRGRPQIKVSLSLHMNTSVCASVQTVPEMCPGFFFSFFLV